MPPPGYFHIIYTNLYKACPPDRLSRAADVDIGKEEMFDLGFESHGNLVSGMLLFPSLKLLYMVIYFTEYSYML